MMHKILVATNGSEVAGRAVDRAAELAARLGVALRIVTVMTDQTPGDDLRDFAESEHLSEPVEPPPAVELPVAGYWSELQPGALANSGAKSGLDLALCESFAEHAERTAKEFGVKNVESQVLAGDPAEAILGVAVSEAVDMIVIGNRGRGAVQSAVLGSVSEKVMHHATCCVLVVH